MDEHPPSEQNWLPSTEEFMKMMNILRTTTPALLVLAVAAFASRSIASPITVIPPGLAAGSQYRLVFITADLYASASPNIATYNNEVNTEANSVVALAALGTTWLNIGSTSSVNAIDNVGQDPGVPIYDLGGQLVADDGTANTGGLFSGDLINPINYFDSGAIPSEPFTKINDEMWTGSSDEGLAFNPLGTPDGFVNIGEIGNSGWLSSGYCPNTPQLLDCSDLSLYAISGVLTVPGLQPPPSVPDGPTPEPGSFWLLGISLLGLICRRARKQQSVPFFNKL
jgi:PEP-CTERM motif